MIDNKIFESVYQVASNLPSKYNSKIIDREGKSVSKKQSGIFFKNALMSCFPEKFASEWRIEDITNTSTLPYIKVKERLYDELREFLKDQDDWAVSNTYTKKSENNNDNHVYYRVSYLGDLEFSQVNKEYTLIDSNEDDELEQFEEAEINDVVPNAKWTVEVSSTSSTRATDSTQATRIYESIIAHLYNNQGFNEHRCKEIGESSDNMLKEFLTDGNYISMCKYFNGLFTESKDNSEVYISEVLDIYFTTIRNSFELLFGNDVSYSRKGSDKLSFLLENSGRDYCIVHSGIKTLSPEDSTEHNDEIASLFTGSKSSKSLINDDTFPADIICYRKSDTELIKTKLKEVETKDDLILLFDKLYYGDDEIKPRTLVGISLKKILKLNKGDVELVTISNREDSDVIIDFRILDNIRIVPCHPIKKESKTSYIYYEFKKGTDNKYFSRKNIRPLINIRTGQGEKNLFHGWVIEAKVRGADAQLGKGANAIVKSILGTNGEFKKDIVEKVSKLTIDQLKTIFFDEKFPIYIDEKFKDFIEEDFRALITKKLSTPKEVSNNIVAWLISSSVYPPEVDEFAKTLTLADRIKYNFARYLAYCAHCPIYDGKNLLEAVSGTYLKIC